MSMTGMVRVNWTCTTSWIYSTPLAWTSQKKFVSSSDKRMMLRRNTASLMKSLHLWNKLSRSQNIAETTMTLLSCAYCTIKMKMVPWCWLNLTPSWIFWVRCSNQFLPWFRVTFNGLCWNSRVVLEFSLFWNCNLKNHLKHLGLIDHPSSIYVLTYLTLKVTVFILEIVLDFDPKRIILELNSRQLRKWANKCSLRSLFLTKLFYIFLSFRWWNSQRGLWKTSEWALWQRRWWWLHWLQNILRQAMWQSLNIQIASKVCISVLTLQMF